MRSQAASLPMTQGRALLASLLLFSAGCDEGLTIARGASKLVVDPTALDFEDVPVGVQRDADLEIKNEGSVRLKVDGAIDLALGGEFSLEDVPELLEPNEKAIVIVHFTPTSPGQREGKIIFTTDSEVTPTVEVPVRGRGVEPALVANPPVLDFGRVVVGRSETATVTLTNRSDRDVEVVRANNDDFTTNEFRPTAARTTLPPGASLAMTVTYSPANIGPDEGHILVLDSSPRPTALNIVVRGEGVESDIMVEPLALVFQGLYTGQTQSQFFQITNIGDHSHDVTEVVFVSSSGATAGELALAAATPSPPFALAAGATQMIEVVYSPIDSIADMDQIRVDSTGLTTPAIVTVDASAANAPLPIIDVQPPMLDFGMVEIGQTRPLTLSIASVGTADLVITGTIAIDPPGAPYALMNAPRSGSVHRPTDISMFSVTFTPTAVGAPIAADVVITSNDPARPTVRVPLTGLGQNTAVPAIFVAPNPLDFGNVPRAVRASRSVLVRNDGTAPLSLNMIRLTNDAGGRFLLPAPPAPGTILAPAQSLNFNVDYLDNGVVATYTGNLEIQSNAPTVNVPLTAATEPPPPMLTDISITMTWTTPDTDVDLHLIRPAGTFFDAPTDCCFCNTNPDWGIVGQANDNAFLDRDDLFGPGPENINLSVAETGQYQVVAHFYSDHGNGATQVTIEVRLRGTLVATQSTIIGTSERWIAGRIDWNAATQTGTWTGPAGAPFFTIFSICN